MRKHERLPASVRTHNDLEGRVIRIELEEEAVAEWTLGLALLKESLVEALALEFTHATLKLELKCDRTLTKHRALAELFGDRIVVQLSTTELEYWLYYFLRYIRDGYADADHIDVEVLLAAPEERNLTLVLVVPRAANAVSEGEARRRLGI